MGSNGGKKPKNRPVLSQKLPVLSMILGCFPQKAKKKSPANPHVYGFLGSPKSWQTFWGEEEQRRERGMIFNKKSSQAIHSL